MSDTLAHQATERPSAFAVETAGATWNYTELDRYATELARRLAGAGAGPGRTIAILLGTGPRFAGVLHAIPRTGATLAPLNTAWTDRELVDRMRLLAPALVLCDAGTEELAARVTQGANIVSLDQAGGTRALHLHELPAVETSELPGPSACDPHSLVVTSGTSGTPRAARFPLHAHTVHAEAVAKRLELTGEERWLATLHPAHIGGLALWLRANVTGATVLPQPRFDAGAVAHRLVEDDVTHVSLVPTMLDRLLDATETAPPSLRCVLVGGAATPEPLLERALEASWPIALTYGLTEAASQVATAPPELTERKPGTVGPALDPVEVRIGEDDELLVRGPTLMAGYLGEATDPFEEEGWLATGDAARIDDDGHVWITGRLSERIVSSGVTVDPVEVEDVLREHPGVRDACVVGVPDDTWGELVAAAVEAHEPGTLDEQAVAEQASEALSSAKRPRKVLLVEELPLNANGKVDRPAVRALLGE